MSQLAHFRHARRAWAGLGVLAALLLGFLCGPAPAPPPVDPVEELRLTLPFQLGDERNQYALKHREDTLAKRVAALKTIGEMRRALVLTEWKDTAGSPAAIRTIDQKARTEIGRRFKAEVETVTQRGSTTARLAVATMLGEMNAGVRALNPDDLSGFTRELEPVLERLVKDRDQGVRAAAARALGKINPVPSTAAQTLKAMLSKGTVADRRAAAEGLVSMVTVVAQLQKKGRTQTGVEANRGDVVTAGTEVVKTAGGALKDADVQVRRLGVEALLQAATSFREMVPEAYPVGDFPPRDRQTIPGEEAKIRAAQKFVREQQDIFEPVIQAAKSQAHTFAKALTDSDPEVREKARRTLEMYGNARLRLMRLIESVPPLAAAAPVRPARAVQQEGELKQDALSLALLPGLEVITRGIRDPNVLVRRSTLDFLESLEDAAAPAVPSIVQALGDPDRFVRWAAARTLSKIGPVKTALSVPALAGLLQDPDLDVSLVAAATLKSFGSDAKAAVPALTEATKVGDAEIRVAALQALASIGVPDAASSIPGVIEALGNTDARVRRAAAETLGSFGPRASAAVSALQGLLQDEDAEVRRAASDALLSIQPPTK
jgi:HEAT repeat protein